jgi:hypothetical protein
MNSNTVRSRAVVLSLALAVVVSACGSGKATPIVVFVTPTPAPSAADTPAPTDTPSPAPLPTVHASSSPSVAPSATPAASASASPAASGSALACTGTAEHLAFFADAAKLLSFDAYCAALPSSWWLQSTQYQLPNGGLFTIEYKNAKGQVISVGEGNFCSGLPDCWSSTGDLGAASFGGLSGSLKARTGSTFAVYVNPGTTHGYQLVGGTGVSQASVVAFAAAMKKIPKS